MPDVEDGHSSVIVVNLIDNAIFAHTNTPALAPRELQTTMRARLIRQRLKSLADTLIDLAR